MSAKTEREIKNSLCEGASLPILDYLELNCKIQNSLFPDDSPNMFSEDLHDENDPKFGKCKKIELNEDLYLISYEYPTRFYRRAFHLFFRSLLVAKGVYMPHVGSVLKPDTMQIKFENFLFYLDEFRTVNILGFILSYFPLNNITRIDIALDINSKTLLDYFHYVQDFGWEKTGRPIEIQCHTSQNRGKFMINGYSLGSRKSEKFGRIYDKLKEIGEESHK